MAATYIEKPVLLDALTFRDLQSRPHVETVVDRGTRYCVRTLKWRGRVLAEQHSSFKRGKLSGTTFVFHALPEGF